MYASEAGRKTVERVAAALPVDLRRMRATSMLRDYYRTNGMGDRLCPACGGAGRLGEDVFERCPICMGFQEVPESLAIYVRALLPALLGARRAYV